MERMTWLGQLIWVPINLPLAEEPGMETPTIMPDEHNLPWYAEAQC